MKWQVLFVGKNIDNFLSADLADTMWKDNTYHATWKFGRWQIDDIFLIFQKPFFWEKWKKKNQNVIC